MMSSSPFFLRTAAVAAGLTSITTFMLWLLPRLYKVAPGFEGSLGLAGNPYYLGRLWINFFHLPLALMGYYGLVLVVARKRRPIAAMALLWFVIWAVVEMVGLAIQLFSVNAEWRRGYSTASEAARPFIRANIEAFGSIWSSAFFVLLTAFLLGSLFAAWATWKGRGVEKLLSALLWLAVPLTLLIILSNYAGQNWAGEIVNFTYPALQPVSRFVLALLLWQRAQGQPLSSNIPINFSTPSQKGQKLVS